MYLTIYNRTTFLIHSLFGTRYHSFREMLKVTSYDKKTLVKITWLENLVLLGVMSNCLFWYCWLVLLGRPSCKPFMSFVDVFTSIMVLFWSFWLNVVRKTLRLFSNNFPVSVSFEVKGLSLVLMVKYKWSCGYFYLVNSQ